MDGQTMLRKSIISETRKGRDQDASFEGTASHRYRYWDPEEPPDFSRLPVTTQGVWPIQKIYIDENVVCVNRWFFRDWEEPLSNFHCIECKRVTTNDPSVGNIIYVVSLIHSNWRKLHYWKFRLTLYEIVEPRFEMSEFLKDMSNALSKPVDLVEDHVDLMW